MISLKFIIIQFEKEDDLNYRNWIERTKFSLLAFAVKKTSYIIVYIFKIWVLRESVWLQNNRYPTSIWGQIKNKATSDVIK